MATTLRYYHAFLTGISSSFFFFYCNDQNDLIKHKPIILWLKFPNNSLSYPQFPESSSCPVRLYEMCQAPIQLPHLFHSLTSLSSCIHMVLLVICQVTVFVFYPNTSYGSGLLLPWLFPWFPPFHSLLCSNVLIHQRELPSITRSSFQSPLTPPQTMSLLFWLCSSWEC